MGNVAKIGAFDIASINQVGAFQKSSINNIAGFTLGPSIQTINAFLYLDSFEYPDGSGYTNILFETIPNQGTPPDVDLVDVQIFISYYDIGSQQMGSFTQPISQSIPCTPTSFGYYSYNFNYGYGIYIMEATLQSITPNPTEHYQINTNKKIMILTPAKQVNVVSTDPYIYTNNTYIGGQALGSADYYDYININAGVTLYNIATGGTSTPTVQTTDLMPGQGNTLLSYNYSYEQNWGFVIQATHIYSAEYQTLIPAQTEHYVLRIVNKPTVRLSLDVRQEIGFWGDFSAIYVPSNPRQNGFGPNPVDIYYMVAAYDYSTQSFYNLSELNTGLVGAGEYPLATGPFYNPTEGWGIQYQYANISSISPTETINFIFNF